MRLYVVQHGLAKSDDEDPQRPLTDSGSDDVARVSRWAVERLGAQPARIVHSGKLRARQTAEIWSALLGVEAEEGDGLAPNDDPTIWLDRFTDETADVMLVGHLPHLARLAAALLTGDSGGQVIAFQQGGLAALGRIDSGWVVTLVLPPSAA